MATFTLKKGSFYHENGSRALQGFGADVNTTSPGIEIEIRGFPVQDSESVSESSSRHVQSRNQTQNQILEIDSLRTGIGTVNLTQLTHLNLFY